MLSYILSSRGPLRTTALQDRMKPFCTARWCSGLFVVMRPLTYVMSISLLVDLVEGNSGQTRDRTRISLYNQPEVSRSFGVEKTPQDLHKQLIADDTLLQ